jgi:hypothetical protein
MGHVNTIGPRGVYDEALSGIDNYGVSYTFHNVQKNCSNF